MTDAASARSRESIGVAEDWWRPSDQRVAEPEMAGRLAFPALMAYIVILIAAPQEFISWLAPFRIALVAGSIALVAYGLDHWTGRARGERSTELVLLGWLCAWAVLTVPFSYWPTGSVNVLVNLYAKSVALCVLVAGVVDTRQRLVMLAGVQVVCTTVIAATAIAHLQSGTLMAGALDRIAGYGGSGMAGNPNDLALLLNISIPLDVALWFSVRRTGTRILVACAILLSVCGVIATFSRAGSLTLAVIVASFIWRLVRRGSVIAIGAIVVLVAALVLVAPAGYLDRLGTVSDISSDQTGSAQDRWQDTVAATQLALAHPLIGAGIGMDYLALNDVRRPTWLSVHNIYLNYAVDLGWIGLCLFLAIFGMSYRDVARVERRRTGALDEDAIRAFAMALRVSLVAFAVAGFFHPVAYHAFFYYLVGLAVAVHRLDRRAQEMS